MEHEKGALITDIPNMKSVTTRVVDSYRMVEKNYFQSLRFFFEKACHITELEADNKVEFLSFYEEEFAVKWFDVIAYCEQEIVGFLRVFRHPEKIEHWLFTDFYTTKQAKREEIITVLYETALKLVLEYDATERISVSVKDDDQELIQLHEKLGFHSLEKPLRFANLHFEENSTEYVRPVYAVYPVYHTEIHEEMLLPLWEEYYKQSGKMDDDVIEDMLKHFELSEKDPNVVFQIKWCGNKKMGFFYKDDTEEIDMNVDFV